MDKGMGRAKFDHNDKKDKKLGFFKGKTKAAENKEKSSSSKQKL